MKAFGSKLTWKWRGAGMFGLWGLAATAVLALFVASGDLRPWHGFLMAIPFMVATTWFGWTVAPFLAPAALIITWGVEGSGAGSMSILGYAELAGVMGVAALVGDRMHRVWRETESRSFDNERRARLLQHAALELNQAPDAEHLFTDAPRLLSEILTFTHAELFVPEGDQLSLATAWRWNARPGFKVPLGSIVGRAYRTGEPQYAPDTTRDPEFIVAPGAEPTRSELALPVKVGGTTRAVINLEHTAPDAFSADDHETLRAFTRIVSDVLERLDAKAALDAQRSQQEFIARLSQSLLHADDAKQAATPALADLVRFLGLDVGGVLELKQARFKPLVRVGDLPAEVAYRTDMGLAYTGLLSEAWTSGKPAYVEDLLGRARPPGDFGWLDSEQSVRTVALYPLANAQGDVRFLLGLASVGRVTPLTEGDLTLISRSAQALGAALDRVMLNKQLFATLDVIRRLARAEAPSTLFQRATEAAVELIPGAEAASVVVKDDELFRFEAAVGYDLAAIKDGAGPFTLEETIAWYAGSESDFRRGIGRIARGAEVLRFSVGSTGARTPANLAAARVNEIRSNICIPITEGSDVVALLNVDNYSSDSAFGTNSLRIAEAFAQHIAVIVRQAEQVRRLEESLVTDGLTRLGNREGFQRKLVAELARAERYGHPLNLVMVDLDNFKQVNDRFGHAAGDAALVAVAEVLTAHLRSSDHAFRWAGDEFILLLPEVKPQEAQAAAERYSDLVESIEVHGLHIAASVGVASYPVDGVDAEALLRRADDLMYVRKQRRREQPVN